jgi:hypothetical protein
MLDKLPPELLRLVGEAACPRSEIANDLVIHGAALDASGHLVLGTQDGRRPNLEARQILVHARAVCRFLRDGLPSPRLKLRSVVGPGADGVPALSGTNTWIPEDVVFPAAGPYQNKVIFRYEVRVRGQGEVIGGLSRSRARFGTGAEDALTWYLAPHRTDFGLHTRMFQDIGGAAIRRDIRLVPGRWHSVMMVLEKHDVITRINGRAISAVKAYYYLDGQRVQICVLSMSNGVLQSRFDPVDRWGVPGQRFGMITYDTLPAAPAGRGRDAENSGVPGRGPGGPAGPRARRRGRDARARGAVFASRGGESYSWRNATISYR